MGNLVEQRIREADHGAAEAEAVGVDETNNARPHGGSR